MGAFRPLAKYSKLGNLPLCLCLAMDNRGSRIRSIAILALAMTILLSLGCKNFTSQRQIVQASFEDELDQVPIGEVGRVNNLAVTFQDIRTTNARDELAREAQIRFSEPTEGHVYLLVNAQVNNRGEETEVVSSRQQINLFDSNHSIQDWSLVPISKGTIDGRIDPGQERRGDLVWEVSEDAEGLTLVFGGTVFAIGDVTNFRPGSSGK